VGMRLIYNLKTAKLKDVPEQARWAESLGYDGLCTEETGHDPFYPLLLAASATTRLTLETRVAIVFPRSPMSVAYAAWDLQEFSGGRFRLGMGTQVKGHMERRFSVPWDSPGPRLREYVQALHAIWDTWQEGKKLDFRGSFYNFSLMTPFFSPGANSVPKPRVYISAINPYNCRTAGQLCDGLALHPISSAKYVTEAVKPNVTRGAEKAGRSPSDIMLNGSSFVITGPSREAVEAKKAAAKQQIAFYASTRTYTPVLEVHGFQEVSPALHALSVKGEWDKMGDLISDEMLDTLSILGPYDEVAGRIKERFGGLLDEYVFSMDTPTPSDEQALKKIIEELKS